MSFQNANCIADLTRGGDPAIESNERVHRAAMRVDASNNTV